MDIVRWTGEEARAAAAGPDLDRRVGVAHGIAAAIVDLDEDDPGDDLADHLTRLPAVAIGAGPQAGGRWDITPDDVDAVVAGVVATPLAAVVTTQLLRGGATRRAEDALLAESLAYATLQSGPEFAGWLAGRGRKVRNDDAPRVRVDDRGDHVDVVLTRGRLRNLLDARMRDELTDALRALALGGERPIHLRGEGRGFCAGGDPAEFGTVEDPTHAHLIRSSANVAPWLLRLAARTTAHVHGPCVGAGVELAAFCTRVTAAADSRFRLPETTMGLMPGAGGTVSIPARIGRRRTLEWLLTGAEVDAATALDWGLVDDIDGS